MRAQDVALDVALEFFIAATRVSVEMSMLGCRERHEGIVYVQYNNKKIIKFSKTENKLV